MNPYDLPAPSRPNRRRRRKATNESGSPIERRANRRRIVAPLAAAVVAVSLFGAAVANAEPQSEKSGVSGSDLKVGNSSGSRAAETRGKTYTNPEIEPVAADPSIIRTSDGTYYLYATEDTWDNGYDHIMPIFKSRDLVQWEYVKDVFFVPPSWKEGGGGLWAPDISFHDGTYYLYYAFSKWGDPDPAIGLATAPSPEGPWKDSGGPVITSTGIGVSNSIDPFVWEEHGKRTLVFGSFHGIYAVELSKDGTKTVGEKVELADSRFEGSYIIKRAAFYYLFVSSGSCCEGPQSTYTLWVGRSRSLDGPYVDSHGRKLRDGGGDLVLSGNDHFVGPGHNSVALDDAGNDWLVYHAIDPKNPWLRGGATRRPVLIDRIRWVAGWPVVNGGNGPSYTPQLAPVIRRP